VTVLVVDDDDGVRRLLERVLSNAGYAVRTAGNGNQALEQFRRGAIDALVTDLVMPECEGIETIRIVRKRNPRLPIVAISGQVDEYLHAAKLLGADVALQKPVRPALLVETLRRLLARG
jgi:CheY-like chemotaxis protein